jgi:site-specific recombinase XerD
LVGDLERGTKPKDELKKITIKQALDAFVSDCEARNLNRSTLGKYKSLRTKLVAHLGAAHDLSRCTPHQIREFRQRRSLGARTAAKELERVRAFFRFCIDNGWIQISPARSPQAKTLPRLPFSEKEIQNVLAQAKDDRELAFLLTLRHTGLRIGDASLLRVTQFSENRIHLYTSKAGTPVSILIPGNLVSLFKTVQPRGGYFFLRGESTTMDTAADLWRRRIKILCAEAKVSPAHPHRFRHTLAADLLSKGASVEDVAAVLGNSPAVVMKHYSQWIKSRQDRLDSVIAKTWTKQLVRVK